MTPRSSGPGGEYPPLRGTTNLRLTANQHCNVTENCAGVLAGATSPANRVAAQLQTAWVTLGKQTLSTSRKRRRTDRVSEMVGLIGYVAGGLPGQRLLARLSIGTSDDTVLRRIQQESAQAPSARPI